LHEQFSFINSSWSFIHYSLFNEFHFGVSCYCNKGGISSFDFLNKCRVFWHLQ